MPELPEQVNLALTRLQSAGFEAYLVGGCVRDRVMGRTPRDYDIATSALPEETERVFAEERVVETGIRHGTVTVILGGMPLEITTYRVDGTYSDGRRPDAVRFTTSLREDLSRRDFTLNAMAWSPAAGLVDPFGGQADIRSGLIRCVGEPELRFREDALRIVRALRFSSELGFPIEPETDAALRANAVLLKQISVERIAAELRLLLCGAGVRRVLLEYAEVLGTVIPELLPMQGFDQKNKHHIYDVLEHCAAACEAVPAEPTIRMAALLHDVGKPACFFTDAEGVGHFYGHAERGAEMADPLLRRLRYDNASRERITELVRRHDMRIDPTEKAVLRVFRRFGPEFFFQLLEIKRADALAHAPGPKLEERMARADALESLGRALMEKEACFSLRDLAVNGSDLLGAGFSPGPAVGAALNALLAAVMDDEVPNERGALLSYLQEQQIH